MAALLPSVFLGPLVLLALWCGLNFTPQLRGSRIFVAAVAVICLAVGWSLGIFLHSFLFGRIESFTVSPPGALQTRYFVDFEFVREEQNLFAKNGHLLVLIPGAEPAKLDITIFLEDREPRRFELAVSAKKVSDTVFADRPVEPNSRFALRVESDRPVFAQAT